MDDTRTCPFVIDPEGHDVQGEAARLRAEGGVVPVELPAGVPAWSVNTYEAVRTVFAHPDVLKDPRTRWPAYQEGRIPPDWTLNSWIEMDSMAIADGADHRRLRNLLAPVFQPGRLEELRPRIREIVDGLLDGLAQTPAGEPVELRERYAYMVPATLILDLFGVPEPMRPQVLRGGQLAVDTSLSPEEAAANVAEWQEGLAQLIAGKREQPGDDMISEIIAAQRENPDVISEHEFVGSLFHVFGAGSIPGMNLIAQAILAMLRHPEQLELVRRGEASWADVVEETLRTEPAIVQLPLRYAAADVEIDGVTIPAGDAIVLCLAAAGRDPAVNGEDPDRFDVTRKDGAHLSFGHGTHYCLGAPLIRMQCEIALEALFTRFPDAALAAPDGLEPQASLIMNGPVALPVTLR